MGRRGARARSEEQRCRKPSQADVHDLNPSWYRPLALRHGDWRDGRGSCAAQSPTALRDPDAIGAPIELGITLLDSAFGAAHCNRVAGFPGRATAVCARGRSKTACTAQRSPRSPSISPRASGEPTRAARRLGGGPLRGFAAEGGGLEQPPNVRRGPPIGRRYRIPAARPGCRSLHVARSVSLAAPCGRPAVRPWRNRQGVSR